MWSPVPVTGLEEERLFLTPVAFSSAPHSEYELGKNKREVSASGGALNEVVPVLLSFLRNFREMQRSSELSAHRRRGGSGA